MEVFELKNIRAGKFRGVIASSYDTPEWREILSEPGRLLSMPGSKIIKNSPTTCAALVTITAANKEQALHIKKLNRRGMIFTFKYLFQRSRARRLFRRHVTLIHRGVPTIRPVAALSRRFGPFLLDSFLITEQLKAKSFFELWENEIYPSGNSPEKRRKIMSETALLIAQMHKAGVFHRDLKSSNILVKENGEPVIADLDGARISSSIGYRQRVRDLARLSTSLVPLANIVDRQVFLKKYIEAFGQGDDLKKMGRDIAVKGLLILRSKRSKMKYDEHDYRYLDEFVRRQSRWLKL